MNTACRVMQRTTHTPFNGPLSGTTRVSRYQKGKTNLNFTGARDSEWQCHQLGHMQVCTSLQTDNHASTSPLFLQAGCPSCRPTNSVKALKAIMQRTTIKYIHREFIYQVNRTVTDQSSPAGGMPEQPITRQSTQFKHSTLSVSWPHHFFPLPTSLPFPYLPSTLFSLPPSSPPVSSPVLSSVLSRNVTNHNYSFTITSWVGKHLSQMPGMAGRYSGSCLAKLI